MVDRQPEQAGAMQASIKSISACQEQAKIAISRVERSALAHSAIRAWWDIYDRGVFWGQCELLGQQIMEQQQELVSMLRDQHLLKGDSELRLASNLGCYLSAIDKSAVINEISRQQGKEHAELVLMLSADGLAGPDSYVSLLLRSGSRSNAYLEAALGRFQEDKAPFAALTETEMSLPTEATRWKLEALRQVRSLVGSGLKKIAALSEIATATRHSIDQLQEWERNLVKFSDYENDLFCAELVGELGDQLSASHFTNIRNYQFYGSFKGVFNLDRAARIGRHLRKVRLSDIQQGLRGIR